MNQLDKALLNGSLLDYIDRTAVDLLDRWSSHQSWWDRRLDAGIDPYSKFTSTKIATECEAGLRNGGRLSGVNFGSQEYLNLSSHPEVHKAAKKAIDDFGVHSAGSAALMGNTRLSMELEERLASFFGYKDCTVFPTGWGAGYGVIKTLVGPEDYVVIDNLAHACLHEGARGATANVISFPHLSHEHVLKHLERIRAENPNVGILVVTETVFSMDSDVPDISTLQSTCKKHSATLLVDAAHDMGAIGDNGGGYLEIQGISGIPDILMGSFSKTFASNGGYVACNNPNLKLALRYGCGPLTFTNALSPIQCSIVIKCLDIICSNEGAELRGKLLSNVMYMRKNMTENSFDVLGKSSAIVPVILGDNAISRLITHHTLKNGGITNLVEYPAVRRNTSRWRLQVMANHTKTQIDRFIDIAVDARTVANEQLEHINKSGD
ncbi:pyridoxal phosphate-dependent aminotransferase family protein [Methylobacterium sp. WL12]|uniref:aminotransferase class I/II-fold pyridoxal phosphate-dependent enzyme n=1 Tax=Methylobacterium sp. WL12 TaxID=2603890 RepID=UPI0011C89F87|nr:pyridoxal phosphate-dependent aminotransferase family protein [Methylobacterium sp. WL12]TXM63985.1 pyridoxal phosphate-dependent aminotransferase family protein [Methylobacterium sp. WL12]